MASYSEVRKGFTKLGKSGKARFLFSITFISHGIKLCERK